MKLATGDYTSAEYRAYLASFDAGTRSTVDVHNAVAAAFDIQDAQKRAILVSDILSSMEWEKRIKRSKNQLALSALYMIQALSRNDRMYFFRLAYGIKEK
jgi:hypothetical protein